MRFLGFCIAFICCISINAQPRYRLNIDRDLEPLLDKNLAPFYHGVASGDPTDHSVIIWTKLTLTDNIQDAIIGFEFDSDSSFADPEKSGTAETDGNADFCVKVDIGELKPGTKYYYRFKYEDRYSIIGQTQTLPSNPKDFSIAFASCSNYEWGYFNNYRFIANNTQVDLVVHLGDYIYEYAPNKYGDTTIGRVNVPDHEIVSLYDYRTRYSLYRLDKDLIRLHQMKPTITTWDDHEIANNGYTDGAQNHQKNEGDWHTRKSFGKQAYYEWMPVRDNSYHELYRSFKIGSLLELIILDTRIAGRSKQVDSESDPTYLDSTRTILGKDQYNWLVNELRDKSTKWKIIGNQVPFGTLYQPDFRGKADKYMDGWDGYPFERTQLIRTIQNEKLKNMVWVTGDYHVSFALENDLDHTASNKDNASVEFVVTSITSANDDDEGRSREEAIKGQQDYLKFNPHLKYVNNVDHGYLILKIEKGEVSSDFYYTDTVRQPSTIQRKEKSYYVKSGKSVLVEKKD